MDELIAVLRGSNAIAVPSPAQPTKTLPSGNYNAATDRWLKEMEETVRISRARRKGLIHDE